MTSAIIQTLSFQNIPYVFFFIFWIITNTLDVMIIPSILVFRSFI